MTDQAVGQTGAELVVRALEAEGVTHVFGVPGAKIDAVFNALVDSRIQTVVCRHEQNAALIAGGIGRLTDRAGVVLATSGPGVANLTTGLATANSEGDPIVALGGAVAAADTLKQVHQTLDAVSLLRPVTKYSASVGAPSQINEILANAFRAAQGGWVGAAYVNLPKDMMEASCLYAPLPAPAFSGPGAADTAAIMEAARLIDLAASPVVLLGLLASRPANAEAIRTLLTRGNLPVVGTFQAAGAVSDTLFDHFGGRVGQVANQPADRLLDAADLIVTIGYDPVEYWPSLWNRDPARKVVHVDVLPATIENAYRPYVELTGDIAKTLAALAGRISRRKAPALSDGLLKTIVTERAELDRLAAAYAGRPVHPLRLVHELKQFLGTDTTVCLDMGSFHLWIARHLYSFRARQILVSNGQQTLGVALPWAIASALTNPSEKVLSISGDGGFLFSAVELETAVRLKLNIVHLVWIDGTYDMVAVQERLKYGRVSGVELGPLDYIKFAESFGATGFMIGGPDDVAPVMRKAFAISGPVLIGVNVDYRDNHKLFEQVIGDAYH